MPQDNPFIRGYQNPRIVRTLLITYTDDCPPLWRPLHASQAQLADDQVTLSPCLIAKEFAVITDDQDVPESLQTQCVCEGIVRAVVYFIVADDFDGTRLHVGDTYSEESAREVVRRLRFDTGFYSRCFEINSAHLNADGARYLATAANSGSASIVQFEVFQLPHGPIGVKLIATPWTDANLQAAVGLTVGKLRHAQRRAGVPDALVDLLHQAATADVRLLVFDDDAPVLRPLALHDE
jgi:hypothetical protein